MQRAYIGYEYHLNENFYTQIKLDIGSPENISEFARIRRYAYFKNTMLRYKKNRMQIVFVLVPKPILVWISSIRLQIGFLPTLPFQMVRATPIYNGIIHSKEYWA